MLIPKIKASLQLMRVDKPVGFFLLLWPTLWALWIAGQGQPDVKILLIFIAGVFIMRSAGDIINDIADRNFDGYVARTKERPLATGAISVRSAVILFFILLSFALVFVLQLNLKTILIACVGALLTALYPFMKRYTYLPQIVLGIVWNLGVLMAHTAQTNHLPLVAWLVYFTAIIWTVAYDTMYAMADKADDLALGLKSTAILFGRFDRLIIACLQVVVLYLLSMLGYILSLSAYYFIALFFAAGVFAYQQGLIWDRNPKKCTAAFLNSNWFGAVIFVGIVATCHNLSY